MSMKHILLALTLGVTGFAFADDTYYLYWMVDLNQAGKNPCGIEGFSYATVSDDGGSSYLSFYNTSGQAIGTGMAGDTDPTKTAGPLYSGLGTSIASSYLFELWLEDEQGDVTRVGWATYAASLLSSNIFTSRGQTGATPLTISVVPEPTSALLLLFGIAGLALRRRKALLAVGVAAILSSGAFAAGDDLIYPFEPNVNDAYADGTPVREYERYALVWLANGSQGVEIAADCTVVDPSKGEIVKVRCSLGAGDEFTFTVDAAKKDELVAKGGKWAVYLLDTRVYDADGSVTLAKVVNGKAASVNAAKLLEKSVVNVRDIAVGSGNPTIRTDATSANVATALPADAPNPEITGITVVDGQVHVRVRQTLPCLQYNLAGGATVDAVAGKKANSPKNGVAGGEIELVAPAGSGSGFFKVNRN